jgi:hypothetical protein
LQGDDVADRVVFDRAQLVGLERAGFELGAGG